MTTTDTRSNVTLFGHLMRRAAFGKPASELEQLSSLKYEELVDDLVDVNKFSRPEEDLLERHNLQHADEESTQWSAARWVFRMINSDRPLEEKAALMWHGVFATGSGKVANNPMMRVHYELLRDYGLGNFRDLLVAVAKDPAMIYWLDQQMNHAEAPNENFGRELLELFSMGIGNYSEDDVKECARAFTGWTKTQTIPRYPGGFYPSKFVYKPEDHDDGIKTFLGKTGTFNGEDIIDIIVQHPATAKFVATEIYDFFVADNPSEEHIDQLAKKFKECDYVIGEVLKFLFNSDFFKESLFEKVKSPAEIVAGTVIQSGRHRDPYEFGLIKLPSKAANMGQQLLNPPTVEGWHTGREWIDSSFLVERINFASEMIGDIEAPRVKIMIDRISKNRSQISMTDLLDSCLYELGCIDLKGPSRKILFEELEAKDVVDVDSDEFRSLVAQVLRLIAASREYQFA